MDDAKHDFYLELMEFVAHTQFLEEVLKFYLFRCEGIVAARLDGFLPYHAKLEAIQNSALGRLIEQFRQYSDNADLISRLRKFKPIRDKLVHASLVELYVLSLDEEGVELKRDELVSRNREAEALIQDLRAECESVHREYKRAVELAATAALQPCE